MPDFSTFKWLGFSGQGQLFFKAKTEIPPYFNMKAALFY